MSLAPADLALLQAWEDLSLPPQDFGHREHVRVAWALLHLETPTGAIARFASGLRAFASAAGAGGKYHETITWAFMLLILDRIGRDAPAGWDAFIDANPDLLDRGVLHRYYQPETLLSSGARQRFVMPDRGL